MNHPLSNYPAEKRKTAFIVLVFFTLLVMLILNITGKPLISSHAPNGIISYELAGTEETAQEILDSWDGLAKIYAGFNLGFDYLFLILYSTTIALAITWLVDLLNTGRNGRRFAVILATGLSVAAVLDAVENGALFTMLVNGVSSPWPQIAFVSAAIKFTLVFLGLAYVCVGFIIYLIQSTQKKTKAK